jgi:hypothetical protein
MIASCLLPVACCLFACSLAAACGDDASAAAQRAEAGTPAAAGTDAPAAGASGSAAACDAPRDVFPLVCGTSICHDGPVNRLDLIAPGVAERLLDVPAAGVHCATSGLLLVDSQQPEHSLLLAKLTEQPPCGSPMPLGSGPAGLTQTQLDCIAQFVATLAR